MGVAATDGATLIHKYCMTCSFSEKKFFVLVSRTFILSLTNHSNEGKIKKKDKQKEGIRIFEKREKETEMGCGSSSEVVESKIVFTNGKPEFIADEVVKCFQVRNGLVFRMINTKTKEWAYYNDTKEYEARVTVKFNQGSHIVALGNTTLEALTEGETPGTGGECVGYLLVEPLRTELFIRGDVNGFDAKVDARLIEIPEPEEVPTEAVAQE